MLFRSVSNYYDSAYLNKFNIQKFDPETNAYVAITVPQTISSIREYEWEPTMQLAAGKYKIIGMNPRMDGGWYLEETNGANYLVPEITMGVVSPTEDIVMEEKEIVLKDESSMTLPIFNYHKDRTYVHHCITQGSVYKYLHQIFRGVSYHNWNSENIPHSKIYTYRIDETNKELVDRKSVV